ncbi:MAG TPA: tRNA (cytosine(32)/uridine(32)-2'-O)-methyltransferase TrmJ [Pseudomonadales bacterium]|jgi:TrmH family RNA methyltransferase
MQALEKIRIVLVNTVHSGNIGGVARAMKNMGLRDLWLVSPQRFPDPEASWRAVAAADVLDNARVVSTVDEAIADCALVIGTSARERKIPWPIVEPRECAGAALDVTAHQQPVAILFGREDYGLNNEELQRCNVHVTIPTDEAYSSLNLAMAVQIISYELRMAALAREGIEHPMRWDQPLATSDDLERLYAHFEATAIAVGFLDPERPRQLMPRMRRLFSRSHMDVMELNVLRGMLAAMDHALSQQGDGG